MVVVEAGTSKRRRRDEQPLQPDLVEILRAYLADKPAGKLLWPGSWKGRAAEMLRIDLEAAGIPYINDAGEYADFHAQRHTYITVAAKHLPPKMAQALARHSDSRLTDRYTHLGLHDTGAAAAQLPPLLATSKTESAQATGTDGRLDNPQSAPVQAQEPLRQPCQNLGTKGHLEAQAGTQEGGRLRVVGAKKTLETREKRGKRGKNAERTGFVLDVFASA